MTTHVASEDWQYMPPVDIEIDAGRGGTEPPERRLPAGMWHAVEAGAGTTVCGRGLRSLHEFADHPFHRGLANRCDACRAGAQN